MTSCAYNHNITTENQGTIVAGWFCLEWIPKLWRLLPVYFALQTVPLLKHLHALRYQTRMRSSRDPVAKVTNFQNFVIAMPNIMFVLLKSLANMNQQILRHWFGNVSPSIRPSNYVSHHTVSINALDKCYHKEPGNRPNSKNSLNLNLAHLKKHKWNFLYDKYPNSIQHFCIKSLSLSLHLTHQKWTQFVFCPIFLWDNACFTDDPSASPLLSFNHTIDIMPVKQAWGIWVNL